MQVSCEKAVKFIHESSINMLSNMPLGKAFTSFKNNNLQGALAYYAYAYALGSSIASESIKHFIQNDSLERLILRSDKDSTILTLESFGIYKGQNPVTINRFADMLYYGARFEGAKFEQYQNSFKVYQAAWRTTQDFYALYSLGYMYEQGQGVDKPDRAGAIDIFKRVFFAGVEGKVSRGVIIPSLGSLIKNYGLMAISKLIST